MTTYRQIFARLFFIIVLPFVLAEGIIKNPGRPFASVSQLWHLLLFIALLAQPRKTDTNNKKESVCC